MLEAYKCALIYIFPNGELEHYYTQSSLDYLNFSDKDKSLSFQTERDFILSCNDPLTLETVYENLLPILKASVPQVKVDLSKHLKYQIVEWIQTVQRSISKGDIIDINGLKTNARIDYKLYNQILEVTELVINSDKRFICKIKINKTIADVDNETLFTETTIPHDFKFKI